MRTYRLLLDSHGSTIPIILKGTEWTLGRDSSNDILVNDPQVSRRHAVLYLHEDRLWVRDIAARNPTLVEGATIHAETELEPGTRLQFGDTPATIEAVAELRAHIVHGTEVIDQTDSVAPSPTQAETWTDVALLHKLADSLAPVTNPEDAARLTIELLMKEVPSRRGLVARIGVNESLRVLASLDKCDDRSAVRVSRTLVTLLRHNKGPACLRTVGTGNRSWLQLAAPLVVHGVLMGLVYLERLDSEEFESKEFELIGALARVLSSRLELLNQLVEVREKLTSLQTQRPETPAFLGVSGVIEDLRHRAQTIASRRRPILILGESGSGKETLARHIHEYAAKGLGPHAPPFVVVSAKAIGERSADDLSVLEAELFEAPDNRIEASRGGTLCIRDIEGLGEALQERLAQTLMPGADQPGASVRLIATSTLSWDELLAPTSSRGLSPELAKLFSTTLEVPPLRVRPEDLPVLTSHFLEALARQTSSRAVSVSPRAMDRLRAHPWPNNVAELQQVITTAGILAHGKPIYPRQLPKQFGREGGMPGRPTELPSLSEIEEQHIRRVLEAVGGNKVMAARVLGIANSTLYEKMKRYEI